MQRRNWITIAVFVGIVLIALGLTFNDRPLLGLDLQGGVAVVLQPKGNPPGDSIEQAKNIIRQRVDALGVAEPDIVRQGDTIVVQLPGVKDRDKALAIIGRTAKLEFRPVVEQVATGYRYDAAVAADGGNPCVPGEATATTAPGATTSAPPTTAAGGPTTAAPAAPTSAPAGGGGDESGAPAYAPPVAGESASGPLPRQATESTTTTPATTDPATTAPAPTTTGATTAPTETTAPTDAPATSDGSVVVPIKDGTSCLKLGPVGFEGKGLSSAQAELQNEWAVNVKIKSNTKPAANQLMNTCFQSAANCPTGQSAIVLDNVVQSAPRVQAADLASNPNGFIITGNFTSAEAQGPGIGAQVRRTPGGVPEGCERSGGLGHPGQGLPACGPHLRRRRARTGGALCALLLPDARAGRPVVAGDLGWAAVGGDRLLGRAQRPGPDPGRHHRHHRFDRHCGGLQRSCSMNTYARTSTRADRSVRWFRVRSTRPGARSSPPTWCPLIAAGLLYVLTVGAVRGFAFYLGLSTILDLIASYFLMRPLVLIMARNDKLARRPGLLGLKLPVAPEGAKP